MKDELFDLTKPQKSIWLTEQYYKNTSINNICGTSKLNFEIDFKILQKAINLVIEKNESFQIQFKIVNGIIKQFLKKSNYFDIEIVDINEASEISNIEKNLMHKVFEIENSYLFEFKIFRFPNHTGGFILNIHHLLADSWTLGLTCKEIIKAYTLLLNNDNTEINSSSYLNYCIYENEYLNSEKFIKDKEYWNSVFSSIPEVASIPSKIKNSYEGISCSANRTTFTISKNITDNINDFCKNNKISIFNFFMSIYAIYISRVSNLSDFVIGTPILNRTNFIEKNTTGMFISTVPLRINFENITTFNNLVSNIASNSMSMLRHQKYPYEYILEDLRYKNQNLPNLYNILLSYQITKANTEGLDYDTRWSFNGNCADELQIHILDINNLGCLNISYDYKNQKYTEKEITEIHNRILHIIQQILSTPSIKLDKIEIITEEEKNELLYQFNNSKINYDKNIPLIKYFEEQVKNHPKDIALVFENATMTYETLNEKANSLAYVLRKKGVTNNSIVGIMERRSFEMIIAILAVLKSGGSYIPIDPDYPRSRIEYMLSDSKASILLSEKSLKDKIPVIDNVIYISLNNTEIYDYNKENLENISKPDDLSYIIYTSGSTGKPKGVLLTQKTLSNFYTAMLNYIEYLPEGNKHSIISITTLSFDIFIFESLISLTRGLKLYITNYYEQKITTKLEKLINENNIDIIQSTPSVMQFHLDNLSDNSSFSKLKYIILAGEVLPKKLVNKIKAVSPNCTIYNGYGPSETTIFSAISNVGYSENIDIGKPIGNTQIYILDKTMNLVPKGIIGELYISGDGVGKGYIYKENLTKERFIPNPFVPNTIMYRTGDIGLWQDNGTILCKGRIDNQVKLRGLRVELGEIEEKILSFTNDNLLKCAVIFKNNNGKESLNAFISYPHELDIKNLKSYLLKSLPNYMMPSTYTFVDKLPLTPNGKIDRKALQNYNINLNSNISDISLPRNKTEKLLLESISKKLNNSNIGIDSNIFECGADSLTIINILTDLFKYNFNLKVYDFYKYPTVRELYDNLLTKNKLRKNLNTDKYALLNKKVSAFSQNTSCKKIHEKKSVFLTGVTGFLGAHILAELLNNPSNINKIYCAIRLKNNINSKTRLFNKIHFYFGDKYDELINNHVVIVEANISEENFGLSNDKYSELAQKIDLVIHTAANVKHYGKYSDFEKINVIGTKNVIKFCKISHAQMHYTSTMTVSGNYLLKQDLTEKVFNENSFYQKQKFDQNVYAKSKLLAEGYIIESIENGINATIYRVGDLTGRYSDGVFQENINENSIYLRLKSILEIGKISESILNNTLEFTPVDYAAKSIVNIIWSDNNINRIFNIYNPNMITTHELIKYLHTYNYTISTLPSLDFAAYVQELSKNSESQSKITGIINDFTSNNELIYNYTIKQNNDITCAYLKNLNFEWPSLDLEYFHKLLQYMKKVNFIK